MSTALLLNHFLGFFGAHRFYVGKWVTAVIMLLLSLTIYGLVVTIIWSIVDIINLANGHFKDAKGQPLLPPGASTASGLYERRSVKKASTALLLNVFLGRLGIHRFYVGKWVTAVIMLLLCLTLYGSVITGIWSLVDFVILACGHCKDAEARPLSWSKSN